MNGSGTVTQPIATRNGPAQPLTIELRQRRRTNRPAGVPERRPRLTQLSQSCLQPLLRRHLLFELHLLGAHQRLISISMATEPML